MPCKTHAGNGERPWGWSCDASNKPLEPECTRHGVHPGWCVSWPLRILAGAYPGQSAHRLHTTASHTVRGCSGPERMPVPTHHAKKGTPHAAHQGSSTRVQSPTKVRFKKRYTPLQEHTFAAPAQLHFRPHRAPPNPRAGRRSLAGSESLTVQLMVVLAALTPSASPSVFRLCLWHELVGRQRRGACAAASLLLFTSSFTVKLSSPQLSAADSQALDCSHLHAVGNELCAQAAAHETCHALLLNDLLQGRRQRAGNHWWPAGHYAQLCSAKLCGHKESHVPPKDMRRACHTCRTAQKKCAVVLPCVLTAAKPSPPVP